MADIKGEKKPFSIPLTGAWKPVFLGVQLGEGDFQALTNMRYTDTPGITSILGMSKINTTTALMNAIPPTIHYTTTQMTTTGGSQVLWPSGGNGPPYTWVITGGGGTLTPGPGTNPGDITYNPPSTNASCLSNPTIQLTEPGGGTITLSIAVNAHGAGDLATAMWYGVSGPENCMWRAYKNTYDCNDDPINLDAYCGGCNGTHGSDCEATLGNCAGLTHCTEDWVTCNCNPNGLKYPGTYIDQRTPTLLLQGCCPASLL